MRFFRFFGFCLVCVLLSCAGAIGERVNLSQGSVTGEDARQVIERGESAEDGSELLGESSGDEEVE